MSRQCVDVSLSNRQVVNAILYGALPGVHDPGMVKPNTPLNATLLGFPASLDELASCDDGTPLRIDYAFSWEHPLSAHGLKHNVITNATRIRSC